ncbi:hypothetical protein [Paludisphaera mucosa]|uniref:Uncharacterized protein n=1 Tax=Paludisphaera mucosa TaxID=3030827 RepID=A0ABT6F7M7_9BACT|nr:hypothetical protein [Paludisphaera mucosa]MDG3003582.1 hypothetical protein [Paludisphaera mucosa]
MRLKTILLTAFLTSLSAATAQAQYWGAPGVVTVAPSPYAATVYGSPYGVVAPVSPVIVRRTPMVMAPGVTVVRPGWGYGPGYGMGYGPGYGMGYGRGYGMYGRGYGRGWRRW